MIAASVENTLEGTPDFFIINMISADVLNETQIFIQYRGKSKPSLTGDLTIYEYSLDNIIWHQMSVTEGSEINDLPFIVNWSGFDLTWNAVSDMEEDFYNKNIWIRFKAVSDDKETDIVSYRIFFKNPITQTSNRSINNKIDMNGSDLMIQAPRTL